MFSFPAPTIKPHGDRKNFHWSAPAEYAHIIHMKKLLRLIPSVSAIMVKDQTRAWFEKHRNYHVGNNSFT